jgi:putative acetyltransferase
MVAAFAIREYRPDDIDDVIDVFVHAVRQVASRDYTPSQITAWSTVDREEWADWRLTRPTFVAEAAGRVVGFSDLEDDGHLDMMFVHPGHHRRGVATALLDRVELRAREIGLERIYAEASITARSFFENRGFVVIRPITVEEGGEAFDLFAVEKAVSTAA